MTTPPPIRVHMAAADYFLNVGWTVRTLQTRRNGTKPSPEGIKSHPQHKQHQINKKNAQKKVNS